VSNSVRVSVIVPVRNRADLLLKCLRSLVAQDIDPDSYEIIVCDDGSTEDLTLVVAQFQPGPPSVNLLRQPPKGPAAARNMGFRASAAPVFVCLDSDMTCENNFVHLLIEVLDSHPSWVAAEGSVVPEGGENSPLWDAPTNEGGSFLCGATAYRADAIKRVGGFDETFNLPGNEDFEVGIRLQQIGKFGYAPGAIAYHPKRRVTLRTFWMWRRFWKFTVIIAKRYGVLGVPSRGKTTRFPRLRVAFCAIATLPAGRLFKAISHFFKNPLEGALAVSYAAFESICGFFALPEIFFFRLSERRNYFADRDSDA